MSLEPLTEVAHADERVDDGKDDQEDGQHSECGQRPAYSQVVLVMAGLIDADQLEEEVGQTTEVEQDDEADAETVLAPREEGGAQQDADGDGDRGDVQAQLEVFDAVDDDEELDGEAQEEKEVEFEEGDVDLAELISRH